MGGKEKDGARKIAWIRVYLRRTGAPIRVDLKKEKLEKGLTNAEYVGTLYEFT